MEDVLGFARGRSEHLQTFYENQAERYRSVARLSLSGSYVCYLSGAIYVTSEAPTLRTTTATIALLGGGYVLGRVKKEMRRAEKHSDLQASSEQGFRDALQARLSAERQDDQFDLENNENK